MTRNEFDSFCKTLPATTHVVQWGGASVWKVGGKIFAICSNWGPDDKATSDLAAPARISFKCTDLSYQILCELSGVIPAPYLARAGWVQAYEDSQLTDDDLKSYITEAHQIIAAKLTKKTARRTGADEGLTPCISPGKQCVHLCVKGSKCAFEPAKCQGFIGTAH